MADDTKDEPTAYVWVDVGHVPGDLPEGVAPQHGMVAVDPVTGMVLGKQPEYPPQPDDPAAAKPEEPAPKTSSKS